MLEETLIVWAGEFGRTPMSQGGDGRDHHNAGFSIWLCGGGVKPGLVYGATDELGYNATENPADVHDLHATMLRLLGIEHTKLSVKFQGLDVRLTGIAGNTIEGILDRGFRNRCGRRTRAGAGPQTDSPSPGMPVRLVSSWKPPRACRVQLAGPRSDRKQCHGEQHRRDCRNGSEKASSSHRRPKSA